jgi:murein DD-endopeptidase
MPRVSVPLVKALGLSPLPLALRQAKLAVVGDGITPKSRFDLTSLHIFTPQLSVRTWLGHMRDDKRAPIMNFFNHTPTPVEEGWSVRVRQVRDWRGGALTYDSHNGTDFVVPPGTPVAAAASGIVVAIRREFNRGGLKLYIDHGGSLVTTSNHLSDVHVAVGDHVGRGQVVATSGYSGLDAVIGFPWVAPHVHYNVWYGGVAVDPYAPSDAEISLWRSRNDPIPWDGVSVDDDEGHVVGSFSAAGVDRCLSAVAVSDLKDRVAAIADVQHKGTELLIESITYPTRFRVPEAGRLLFDDVAPRSPRLDLPFCREDITGTFIIDR